MTRLLSATIAIVFSVCIFSGCVKDHCTNKYKIYIPIYKTLTQIRSEMKSVAPVALQNTGKLCIYGKYIFLSEVNKGIHVIDNSNPSNPVNLSFINIPGNVDLAIKDDYLYADAMYDLVVFDISDVKNVSAKKFINRYNVNYTFNPDSVFIPVDYIQKDTTVDCNRNIFSVVYEFATSNSKASYYTSAPTTGVNGSMARFTILKDYLYTVNYTELSAYDISTGSDPQFRSKTNVGWNIETIFPFKDKLFIGSNTGMFIYETSDPANPKRVTQFSHIKSCDPVIADDNYAYVTLRTGNLCQGMINELEVLDIQNLSTPTLLKTYSLTNPHGLSKDDKWLFICDGKDGLKIYDAGNANNLTLKKRIEGIETFDVIANNKTIIVVAKDGLYQYDYSDINNVKLLSKMAISNK